METVILGITIWASAAGIAPPPEIAAPSLRAATTLSLREEAARVIVRQSGSPAVPQPLAKRVSRHSKMDRVIAVAAGVSLGWIGGASLGYMSTDNPDNPDDDTSGLKGMIIGAPIGAVAGAIAGFWLTK